MENKDYRVMRLWKDDVAKLKVLAALRRESMLETFHELITVAYAAIMQEKPQATQTSTGSVETL